MNKFYKVRNTECDFCKKNKKIVTEIDNIYICSECAKTILQHCVNNEQEVTNDK